jgi:Mrp family chromosome partitioning ATPase/uncharacterized protein involved in exopolysaccharide biosynthesis
MRSTHESSEMPGDGLQPILRLARRALAFWRLGLIALAVGIAATVAFAKLRPRHYRSEAVLYYREGMQWNPNEGFNTRRQIQRLKEALLARSQLVKVVEELDLFPKLMAAGRSADAVNEMLLATTFRIGEGDIFQLSYTSDSPKEAERVVARLTALLIDENATFRSSQAESSRAFLEAEKSRNEADLRAKEAALYQFLGKHPEFLQEPGTSTGPARGRSRSADDGSAVAALRREEERLRSQIATSGSVPADPGQATGEAAAKLKAAQRDLAAARSRYTEEHPDVRSALAVVRESEDAYNRATAGMAAAAPAVSAADLRAQLDRVQREIAAVDRRNATGGAAGAPAASSDAARHVVALETEWARLNREVGEARERLQQLDSRQFTASMTLGTLMSGQSGKIVIIDPAFVPTTPIGMSNTKAVLLGLAVTLLLAGGLATIGALLDDRIRDRVDVQRLGLGPVLAEIGDLARRAGKPGQKASAGRERAPAAPPPRKDAGAPAASADAGPGEHGPLSLVAGPWASEAAGEAAKGSTSLALKLAQREDLALRGTDAIRESEADRRTVLLNVHRVPLDREAHPRPLMLEEPDSATAAGFRVLRHRLAERGGTRAILVASPSARDGKTTCALNLWIALGEARRSRALLVEANLRDPSIAQAIGFDPPVCIGKQMQYHLALGVHSWDVAETFTPWLHAAAVSPSSEKREMLEGSALSALVQDMKEVGYDVIVVDSPAILGSADATLAEDAVEGVLMVVRRGKTRARDLRLAVEQIGSDKLLGFVLVGR